MKVSCPRCGFSAEVPEDKLPAKGANATCPKCKKIFEVSREINPEINIKLNKDEQTMPCPYDCGNQIPITSKQCPFCEEQFPRETRECDYCEEEVPFMGAIICKHCNGDLLDSDAIRVHRNKKIYEKIDIEAGKDPKLEAMKRALRKERVDKLNEIHNKNRDYELSETTIPCPLGCGMDIPIMSKECSYCKEEDKFYSDDDEDMTSKNCRYCNARLSSAAFICEYCNGNLLDVDAIMAFERDKALEEAQNRLAKIKAEGEVHRAESEARLAKINADAPIMTAVGINGQLSLYKNKVKITRNGAILLNLLQGTRGVSEILLQSITAIRFVNATSSAGSINFLFMGNNEEERRWEVNLNPYAVVFNEVVALFETGV